MFQSETEQPAPTSMLQLGTAVFAFVPTLITFTALSKTHTGKWTAKNDEIPG
jgi:hypothetical protein